MVAAVEVGVGVVAVTQRLASACLGCRCSFSILDMIHMHISDDTRYSNTCYLIPLVYPGTRYLVWYLVRVRPRNKIVYTTFARAYARGPPSKRMALAPCPASYVLVRSIYVIP